MDPKHPNSNGVPGERERERRAAEAPPGSRERSESDVTGWSPERDEPATVRQGRFHRAARLRMAQPRTEEGPPPPEDDTRYDTGPRRGRFPFSRGHAAARPESASSEDYGPYGRDDRTLDSPTGQGTGPRMGEQDRTHSLDAPHTPREYRPWDRTGSDTAPRGTFEPRRREAHTWEDRPAPERSRDAASEGYAGRVAVGQPVIPSREPRPETGRRGRWAREPLTARELMTRHVRGAGLDSGLRDVARIMKEEDCGIVPVVDERGRLVGVLTDRDLVLRTLAEGRPPETMHARDIMTDDVEAVTPDEDIHSILALMGRRQVRRVPVVERDDRLVGIISLADIATRADNDEELQEALDRISARRSFWSRLY